LAHQTERESFIFSSKYLANARSFFKEQCKTLPFCVKLIAIPYHIFNIAVNLQSIANALLLYM